MKIVLTADYNSAAWITEKGDQAICFRHDDMLPGLRAARHDGKLEVTLHIRKTRKAGFTRVDFSRGQFGLQVKIEGETNGSLHDDVFLNTFSIDQKLRIYVQVEGYLHASFRSISDHRGRLLFEGDLVLVQGKPFGQCFRCFRIAACFPYGKDGVYLNDGSTQRGVDVIKVAQ